MSATSARATEPPALFARTIPFNLSMVSYSSSGYSTITLTSSPSTFKVVASLPPSMLLTVLAIWIGVIFSAFAFTASMFSLTTGAAFSRVLCTLETSGRASSSLVIWSDTRFSSSYWVPCKMYSIPEVLLVMVEEDATSIEMFAPAIWFNSGFHSLMTSLVSRFLSSFK